MFSFGNDQYTSITNQKVFTLVKALAQLRFYLKARNTDVQVYRKAMSSSVTRVGPGTAESIKEIWTTSVPILRWKHYLMC